MKRTELLNQLNLMPSNINETTVLTVENVNKLAKSIVIERSLLNSFDGDDHIFRLAS